MKLLIFAWLITGCLGITGSISNGMVFIGLSILFAVDSLKNK